AGYVRLYVADGQRHTRSAVVGGGTPNARDDRDCAASPRRLEELTESIGGCFPRIPSRGRKERQAAGRGELDHRGPPGFDHAVLRRDRIAERSFHARGQVLTMARRDERLDSAVATIGDRDLDDFGVRKDLAHAAR